MTDKLPTAVIETGRAWDRAYRILERAWDREREAEEGERVAVEAYIAAKAAADRELREMRP
jgi:hypothetical protein